MVRHPLLSMQRTAGNQAVATLVQRRAAATTVQARRDPDRYISSGVALAVIDRIYEGRCDATFNDVPVRRRKSAGLLASDLSLSFDCGPQTFRFRTSVPWFGDRFPWGIVLASGGTAWLTDKVSKALDTMNDNWDDEGGGFWDAHRTVKGALKHDIDRFCAP